MPVTGLDTYLQNTTSYPLGRTEILPGTFWEVIPPEIIQPGETAYWRSINPNPVSEMIFALKYVVGNLNNGALFISASCPVDGSQNTYQAHPEGPFTVPPADGWPNTDAGEATLSVKLNDNEGWDASAGL